MRIISHRGSWKHKEEENSEVAFRRALENGFGIETDIRDYNGELIISHDLPGPSCMKLETFFQLYGNYEDNLTLALNIKSCGLQSDLKNMLSKYGIQNYFVFDLAGPESVGYLRSEIRFFTRQSEYEPQPHFYDRAFGVWLDEFDSHWIADQVIEAHVGNQKQVCVVSPELHKRPYADEWKQYRDVEKKIGRDMFMLCTDYPKEAEEFFNG